MASAFYILRKELMFTKLRNSHFTTHTVSRAKFAVSHSVTALVVWAMAILGTNVKLQDLIKPSLEQAAKAFDTASGPFSMLNLPGSGDNPVTVLISSLINALSVLFVPLLPRNANNVPVLPKDYSKYTDSGQALHWVTPDPKTILIWFLVFIALAIFFVLLIDYAYEMLGVLIWFNYAKDSTQAMFALLVGVIVVCVWLYVLVGRLREGDVLPPWTSLIIIGYIGVFMYMASHNMLQSLPSVVILGIGLLVSSYIGFCALFIAPNKESEFKRKAHIKNKKRLNDSMKGRF